MAGIVFIQDQLIILIANATMLVGIENKITEQNNAF